MRVLIAGFCVIFMVSGCISFSVPPESDNQPKHTTTSTWNGNDVRFMDAAWNEYVRRGGTYLRANAAFAIFREQGKIIVFVTLRPPFPGGHFEVTMDSNSGDVLEYRPGA